MLLAEAGFEVSVLEREPHVGGRTSTLELDGFRFDLGPTFFLYPEVLESIFGPAAATSTSEVQLERLDPHYRLVFEGDTADRHVVATSTSSRARSRSSAPTDAAGFDRFLADNRKKLERFRPCLKSPFDRHTDLLKLPLIELLPLLRPWLTLDGELERYFKDPRTRLAFSFQCKYLGMSPFNCPSLFTILSFLEYEFGVLHPRGGCGAVSAAMARVADGDGRARSAWTSTCASSSSRASACGACRRTAATIARDAIVINADFARAMRGSCPTGCATAGATARSSAARCRARRSCCISASTARCPSSPTTRSTVAGLSRAPGFDRAQHVLPEAPGALRAQPEPHRPDAGAARATAPLYVLVPVTHRSAHVDWAAESAPFRETRARPLGAVGVPNRAAASASSRSFTPADWEGAHGLYKGATFNLAHSLDQMLSLRPHNRFEDLEGVYLVGGGTHPGSGLPVIYQSAKITSRLLAEDFGHGAARTGAAAAAAPGAR